MSSNEILQNYCRFECRKLVLVGDPKVSCAGARFLFFPRSWLRCDALVRLFIPRQLNSAFVYFFFFFFFQQLSPTIQGSEPDHEAGLEQTLFDRLMKMVSFMKPFC